jgi:hypothetical protein
MTANAHPGSMATTQAVSGITVVTCQFKLQFVAMLSIPPNQNSDNYNVPGTMDLQIIDNFMRLVHGARNVIIYGDLKSLTLLRLRYPNSEVNKITFVQCDYEDFSTVSLLSGDDNSGQPQPKLNRKLMQCIEKIFMVANSISSDDPTTTTGYAWIDIDSVPSPDYFPLFVGFPDPRKLQFPNHRIVVVSSLIGVAVDDTSDLRYNIAIPGNNIMIGGHQAWESLKNNCIQMLTRTRRESALHAKYWLNTIGLSEFAVGQLMDTLPVTDVFYTTLMFSVPDLFCYFPGNSVHFEDKVMDKHLYLLYQYSATTHASGDLRCTDESRFTAARLIRKQKDFEILLPATEL